MGHIILATYLPYTGKFSRLKIFADLAFLLLSAKILSAKNDLESFPDASYSCSE